MTEGRTNLASAITNHMQKKKKKRARVELGRLRQDPFLCGYNLSSRYYFETRLKIKTLLRFVTLYWEIRSSAMSSFGCLRQIVVIYVDSAKIAIPMLPCVEGRTKWRNNSLGFWQILSLYLRTYMNGNDYLFYGTFAICELYLYSVRVYVRVRTFVCNSLVPICSY